MNRYLFATLGIAVLMLLTSPCAAQQNEPLSNKRTSKTAALLPGQEITLAGALAKAEAENLTLSAAKQEIEKSESLFSKSLALILPSARVSLGYTHLDHGSEVDLSGLIGGVAQQAVQIDPLVIQRQDALSGAISIRQSIVDAGAWLSVKAARRGVELAALSVEEMRRELSLSVARAYFLSLSAYHLTTLQQALQASAKEHLRIAENRYAAGSGVRLDVLRARADLEDATQDLANANLAFDTARDALGVLIGMDGLPTPKEAVLPNAPTLDDAALIESALEDRADIAAQGKRIDLAVLREKIAWTALLPKLDAVWQGTALFTDPPDMGDPDQERWSLMLSLTVPLFDGAIYADIRHTRAEHRLALINKANTEQAARKEVRQAEREYLTALNNVETATRHVEVMREALLLTEKAFRAGSGSSLEVTDARKSTAAAEINLITSGLRVQSALLSLLHASGKDIATVVR